MEGVVVPESVLATLKLSTSSCYAAYESLDGFCELWNGVAVSHVIKNRTTFQRNK